MDENIARIIIAGVIGVTISISMVAMAIAKMVSSRPDGEPGGVES